uniref:Uncharacterized protein n=1 Tax=Ananas comosus var. bracteatus TaxID=296719 RepID=A0A6V7QBT2_ANACO|nr:unnamed protein product [Ananas comosus var. bracteatus]
MTLSFLSLISFNDVIAVPFLSPSSPPPSFPILFLLLLLYSSTCCPFPLPLFSTAIISHPLPSPTPLLLYLSSQIREVDVQAPISECLSEADIEEAKIVTTTMMCRRRDAEDEDADDDNMEGDEREKRKGHEKERRGIEIYF